MEKETFKTHWKEPPDLIPIGGQWLYAIGIIQDEQTGSTRVRIAKGKVKGYVKRNEQGKLEAFPKDANDPITQPNRLNIKDQKEWEKIDQFVKKWVAKIPQKSISTEPK
jgi:hypothetical protein